ncbi:hypothetical protein ACFB49_46410 [Sphingomonas sp. DBB INV C78]|uniref:hypothetical protein n=1 Tax=Sphingomonas sp. DBB INV C78 TaxID=3349434 RepID=UPI0036D37EB0
MKIGLAILYCLAAPILAASPALAQLERTSVSRDQSLAIVAQTIVPDTAIEQLGAGMIDSGLKKRLIDTPEITKLEKQYPGIVDVVIAASIAHVRQRSATVTAGLQGEIRSSFGGDLKDGQLLELAAALRPLHDYLGQMKISFEPGDTATQAMARLEGDPAAQAAQGQTQAHIEQLARKPGGAAMIAEFVNFKQSFGARQNEAIRALAREAFDEGRRSANAFAKSRGATRAPFPEVDYR